MPRENSLPTAALLVKGGPIAALMALCLWQTPVRTEAAVTAGGIAIIGYTDHTDSGADDTFSIALLENISAGTTIYFTDNGWINAGSNFRGASLFNVDGIEALMSLTFSSNVGAGTILKSGDDIAEATWDYSSLIPGGTNGETFNFLSLSHTTGDQIYAFESSVTPALVNPDNFIYALDFGDANDPVPGFEDASDSATGAIPPGLSIVSNTAVTLPDSSLTDPDPDDFHNGSFALNLADADVIALNLSGGTKAQWLALIADSSNWRRENYEDDNTPDAEGSLAALNVFGAPEPSRALLLLAGATMVSFRRRRNA